MQDTKQKIKCKNTMKIKLRANYKEKNCVNFQSGNSLEVLKYFIHHLGDEELEQYTNLNDINGDEIYENDILIDRKNGNCFNVFRVRGGFGINIHKSDFNFDKKPSLFYDSIGDMQTASYISGNCEVIK